MSCPGSLEIVDMPVLSQQLELDAAGLLSADSEDENVEQPLALF